MPVLTARHALSLSCIAAFGLIGGCCSGSPDLDGGMWREPSAKPKLPPTSISVGRFGLPRRSGIGPGTVPSDSYPELGGAGIGRFGYAAQSSVWPETATST